MKRRNAHILLFDLLTVFCVAKKTIKDECVGKYCILFCTKCELIVSQ